MCALSNTWYVLYVTIRRLGAQLTHVHVPLLVAGLVRLQSVNVILDIRSFYALSYSFSNV